MAVTLGDVLASISNWFPGDPAAGRWEVSGGALRPVGGTAAPSIADGQWYAIEGSALNDGLHERGEELLADEGEWRGTVIPLRVPADLLALVGEIDAYQSEQEAACGPYVSESFGGYSYSRATDPATRLPMTWEAAFRSRLNRWRKL